MDLELYVGRESENDADFLSDLSNDTSPTLFLHFWLTSETVEPVPGAFQTRITIRNAPSTTTSNQNNGTFLSISSTLRDRLAEGTPL